jgi:WD40 repeat protein
MFLVPTPSRWGELADPSTPAPAFEKHWFSHLELAEIYDLQWSPDSCYLVAGAINGKAQTVRVRNKDATTLVGHTSYVQGVAWDPLNKYVATQSADRSVKLHQVREATLNILLSTDIDVLLHYSLRSTTREPSSSPVKVMLYCALCRRWRVTPLEIWAPWM